MFPQLLLQALFIGLVLCAASSLKNQDPKDSRMILPEKFGVHNRTELTSAPPCGTTLGVFNGIASYSNGEYQGTGTSCGGWCSTGMQVYLNISYYFNYQISFNALN